MAPQKENEFTIMKLKFVPHVTPHNDRMTLTSKKHVPSKSMGEIQDWFDRVVSREARVTPRYYKNSFSEWNVSSANSELFTIQGYRYNEIAIVMGEEYIYWIFYQNNPHQRLVGATPNTINYCACCMHLHYLKILETIRSSIKEIPFGKPTITQ